LITEATGLNFPENAAIDCDNCRFDETGVVRRRRALDVEVDNILVTASTPGVVREYIWNAVGNSGTRSFLVVQFGAGISFFEEDENGNYGNGEKGFGIALDNYKIQSPIDLAEHPCSFTSGNGRLFVAQKYIDPLAVEYDADTDTITVTQITVEVRDMEGVEDGLEIRERPTTLSSLHDYNLQNQSFNRDVKAKLFTGALVDKIDRWFSGRGDYPSNADIWWLYKNEDGRYSPQNLPDDLHLGNSPAPKGHWIFDAFNIDRNAKVNLTGIPGEQTNFRPSQIAFYAGRVWYSGVEDTDFTQKVYFSQVVEGTIQFGKCYQLNDPTSEQISDLLDSDGGRLSILDMGTVANMQVVQDQLILFTSEGIWSISGGDGTGFKATDFSIRKISSVECPSPYGFIDIDGLPAWWSVEGIYALQPNQTGQLEVRSLTDATIKTFYQDILKESRLFAKGAYDPVAKEVQWIYKSTAPTDFQDNFKYDRLLVLNTATGSFSPWSTDISLFGIAGIYVANGSSTSVADCGVVTALGDNVQNAALDNIVVTVESQSISDGRFKYLTCAAGGVGSFLKFGPEVATGTYDLSDGTAPGHPAFDQEERIFYQVHTGTPNTLKTYSMVDHSLLSSINLTWDPADVESIKTGPIILHSDGLLYLQANPGNGIYGSGTKALVVVDPTTGDNVSLNAPVGVGGNYSPNSPYDIHIFNVAGVTHLAGIEPQGLNNWKYTFWKYESNSWTSLGSGSTFGFNQAEGYIVGSKENALDTDFYYLDQNTDTIKVVNIDSAGTLTNSTKWVTGFNPTEAIYLPNEGNLIIKPGSTELRKYSFDDDLFTQIWANPTALSFNINQIPVPNMSRFDTNIIMGGPTTLTVDVISVATGEPQCTLNKTVINNADNGHWSDDISGSIWMADNATTFWRYQTGCGLQTAGFGFGGEVIPTGTTRDYTDWITANGVGVDYTSYFLTGAKVHADGMRDFQSNYVSIFSQDELNSSCRMHGRWDWSNNTISSEFSTPLLSRCTQPDPGELSRDADLR
jgi:hypothetical protein